MNFKKELIDNILPFWLNNAIDDKNGGIFTSLDRKGNIYGREKSVWFQGRALWTFSKAYNLIEKNPEYLAAAKKIYSFLPKCADSDGRMFFKVTEDGRELQKRRYWFSETFAAIGCAEYYKATGDENALHSAEKYFDTAYNCFVGKIPTEPKFNRRNYEVKALSPVMIMLSTAQVMRSVNSGNKEYYGTIAAKCLDEILNGGFLTEHALLETVRADGKFINSPDGRVVNPGHSMEAAWFVMAEGLLTGNKDAVNIGKRIIDITQALGQKNGGIIAFTDVYGQPPLQLEHDMKLWWPQCEAMIAARLAYSIFNEKKYKKLFDDILDYCKKYFIDTEYGEWYGYLHYDNTPSTDLKGNMFKGPFHIPRLYMIMAVMDETGGIEKFMN